MKKIYIKTLFFVGIAVTYCLPIHAASQPLVQLRLETTFFSPNRDERQDLFFFSPGFDGGVHPDRWRIDIFDSQHVLVNRLSGVGFSALIAWDGRDRRGHACEEGEYQAKLTMWSDGKSLQAEAKSFILDIKAPIVEVALSSGIVDASLYDFSFRSKDNFVVDSFLFQILDERGKTVHVFSSTSTRESYLWNGYDRSSKNLVSEGSYVATCLVWDRAGNQSEPVFLPFVVNLPPPIRTQLDFVSIKAHEIPNGFLVQLPREEIFLVHEGKPYVGERGVPFLTEVARLIQMYPNFHVYLDGYSYAFPKVDKDVRMASFYSWTIYSHLVKMTGVKSSRLTVRSRGRSPLFDRRAINPIVLRNGVEVILVPK